jgi:hypothetical protein
LALLIGYLSKRQSYQSSAYRFQPMCCNYVKISGDKIRGSTTEFVKCAPWIRIYNENEFYYIANQCIQCPAMYQNISAYPVNKLNPDTS